MSKSIYSQSVDTELENQLDYSVFTQKARPDPDHPGTFHWVPDNGMSLVGSPGFHKSFRIYERGGNRNSVRYHDHDRQIASFSLIGSDYMRFFTASPIMFDGNVAAPYTAYEIDRLIKDELKQNSAVPLPPHTIADCEKVFRGEVIDLPTTLKIDRDPFETDFSIWFPIVDLIQLLVPFYRVNTIAKQVRHSSVFAGLLAEKPEFTARDFHNHHLGVKFGILPTIADIKATISMIVNIRTRYDEYKEKYANHINRFHNNNVAWKILSKEVHGTVHLYRVPVDAQYRAVLRTNLSRWHGEAFYTIVIPELGSFISRLKQLVDSFGVLDPAALWDVIPFSFVLDWFFTTNEVMRSLKPRLFRVQYKLWDYLESVNLQSELHTYISGAYVDSPHSIGNAESRVGTTVFRSYARRRFKPPALFSEAPPNTPDPNSPEEIENFFKDMDKKIARGVKPPWRSFCVFNRVATAASLIAQRLPR